MTGRPPLALGAHGDIGFTKIRGKIQARVTVRDPDGVRRQVTVTAATKDAARTAIAAKLATRRTPRAMGPIPTMTIDQLCEYFLEYRRKQTTARQPQGRRGIYQPAPPVRPQTLGAYDACIRSIIKPALGQLRLHELTVGRLETVLVDLDHSGVSTAQARSVLNQMLRLARRHEAIASNPMDLVEPLKRSKREVEALELDDAHLLRHLVTPETRRTPGGRGPNLDLRDYVDVALGTGARIGEILAIRWTDLDLDAEIPTVFICGTLVEPRKGYVEKLHRQPYTKGGESRRLILPHHLVTLLQDRRGRSKHTSSEHTVFASRHGTLIWPNNIRTRLRAAVEGSELSGTSPHTLRRTVGTRITREVSLDAAREQLGHAHPGVTGFYYVAERPLGPDLRSTLGAFFAAPV